MLNIPLMRNNISDADKEALINFIRNTDHFTNGPKVREFERAWSQWLGVRHSLFVHSGSSANFISMAVLRDLYGQGEVIVPPITWSSDIAAVLAAGMEPVFVDVDLDTLAMNERAILEAITPKTKAVFLTHVLGFNGLSLSLVDALRDRGIPLIEDVCESHGASLNGRKCGTFGLASNFSFYYAHHMSSIEGGMICTNDDDFYQYCRLYRSHGLARELDDLPGVASLRGSSPDLEPQFLFLVPGYNMRSTELNAVLGLNQLKRLDANNAKRVDNFNTFISHIDSDKYFTGFRLAGAVNYAFVIIPKENDPEKFRYLKEKLKAANVEFRQGLSGGGNITRQPFVRQRLPHVQPSALKTAEIIHSQSLYTGNYPDLEKEKILKLCELLNDSI